MVGRPGDRDHSLAFMNALIDNIALAVSSAHLAIGSRHLDDRDTACSQVLRQPDTIPTRAFDAGLRDRAMAFKPVQQLRIARGCRREAGSSERTADVIEHPRWPAATRGDDRLTASVPTDPRFRSRTGCRPPSSTSSG